MTIFRRIYCWITFHDWRVRQSYIVRSQWTGDIRGNVAEMVCRRCGQDNVHINSL